MNNICAPMSGFSCFRENGDSTAERNCQIKRLDYGICRYPVSLPLCFFTWLKASGEIRWDEDDLRDALNPSKVCGEAVTATRDMHFTIARMC